MLLLWIIVKGLDAPRVKTSKIRRIGPIWDCVAMSDGTQP